MDNASVTSDEDRILHFLLVDAGLPEAKEIFSLITPIAFQRPMNQLLSAVLFKIVLDDRVPAIEAVEQDLTSYLKSFQRRPGLHVAYEDALMMASRLASPARTLAEEHRID